MARPGDQIWWKPLVCSVRTESAYRTEVCRRWRIKKYLSCAAEDLEWRAYVNTLTNGATAALCHSLGTLVFVEQ